MSSVFPREISVAACAEAGDGEPPIHPHAPHVVGDAAGEPLHASDVASEDGGVPPDARAPSDASLPSADAELYKAKLAGRNRVSIEEQPDSSVSAEEKSLLFGPLYTPSGWGDLPPPVDAPTGSAH